MGLIFGIIGAMLAGLGLAKKSELSKGKSMYSVQSWRDLAVRMAGDIPVPFILKWIQIESGGNPCATGKWMAGSVVGESGIGQLYYPDDFTRQKIDINKFRAACQGGAGSISENCIRPLTGEELNLQMKSLVDYINYARSKASNRLAGVGLRWTGQDYWKLVKLVHALPVLLIKGLAYKPSNWDDFAAVINKLNVPNWIVSGKNKDGTPKYYTQQKIRDCLANADNCGSAVGGNV
jgi:hypothetical protein